MGGDPRNGNYPSSKQIQTSIWVRVSNLGTMQDSFYKTLNAEQHAKAFANEFDFDCPDALDFDALVQTLRDLKQGYY